MSSEEADHDMLRQALDRIRGHGTYEEGEYVAFGLPAMDMWIGWMSEQQGFCPGCYERAPDRAWRDATNVAAHTLNGAKAAVSFLQDRLDSFADDARPHVQAVISRYRRIAELLTPAMKRDSGGHYRTFIGDLDKQKEHAETVLRPVKDELAGAADDIEKALAAVTGAPDAHE